MVVKNVLDAFHSIHALGVFHGDVRKENILVREDESVMIIDFEKSVLDDVPAEQMTAEDEVVRALLDELREERCECVDDS